MAKCANDVMISNGCKDQIKLIPKRSTDIIVGQDMKEKANILVTEVFDTELIGEGAIGTFNHAHKHLLTVWKQPIIPIMMNNQVILKFAERLNCCTGTG